MAEVESEPLPKCGLCGEQGILVTECCNNWICITDQYYGGCLWHHNRYSLCYFHFNNKHEGHWRQCKECDELGGGEGEISESEDDQPEIRCGMCKSPPSITKTKCCGNWICDHPRNDEDEGRKTQGCLWGHNKFSVCARHFEAGHDGSWRNCGKCKDRHGSKKTKYEFKKDIASKVPGDEKISPKVQIALNVAELLFHKK